MLMAREWGVCPVFSALPGSEVESRHLTEAPRAHDTSHCDWPLPLAMNTCEICPECGHTQSPWHSDISTQCWQSLGSGLLLKIHYRELLHFYRKIRNSREEEPKSQMIYDSTLHSVLCMFQCFLSDTYYMNVYYPICSTHLSLLSVQSCSTLCDPMDCNPQGPVSMRCPRQEY